MENCKIENKLNIKVTKDYTEIKIFILLKSTYELPTATGTQEHLSEVLRIPKNYFVNYFDDVNSKEDIKEDILDFLNINEIKKFINVDVSISVDDNVLTEIVAHQNRETQAVKYIISGLDFLMNNEITSE